MVGRDYLDSYQRLYGKPHTADPQPRFHPDALPPASTYYSEQLGLNPNDRSGWVPAICPFHDDRAPSLSVNLDHGGFRCWAKACGAKGGDVLDFHRQRHGLGFKAAAQALGAWR